MRNVLPAITLIVTLASGVSTGAAAEARASDNAAEQERTRAVVMRMNAAGAQITHDEFVAGSLWLTAYHELGHLLIHEYDFPVLGANEEDMADNYAIVTLAPHSKRAAMIAAVQLFLAVAIVMRDKPFAYFDEHSIDQQRAFRMACYLAGAWPDRFGAVALAFEPTGRRMQMCANASPQANVDWDRTLKPEVGVMIDKQTARVTYEPAEPGLEDEMNELKASGVLESVASELQTYRLPEWRRALQPQLDQAFAESNFRAGYLERTKQRIEIIAGSCGEASAQTQHAPRPVPGLFVFDPRRARLVVCYEFISLLHELADGLPKNAAQ